VQRQSFRLVDTKHGVRGVKGHIMIYLNCPQFLLAKTGPIPCSRRRPSPFASKSNHHSRLSSNLICCYRQSETELKQLTLSIQLSHFWPICTHLTVEELCHLENTCSKSPPLDLILSELNLSTLPYFFTVLPATVFPSTTRSPKWSLPMKFSEVTRRIKQTSYHHQISRLRMCGAPSPRIHIQCFHALAYKNSDKYNHIFMYVCAYITQKYIESLCPAIFARKKRSAPSCSGLDYMHTLGVGEVDA
jgi:hypothetical protein